MQRCKAQVTLSLSYFFFLENIGVDNPNLFEGDMILTGAQRMAAEMGLDIDNPTGRAGIKSGRWPGGVVPYTIDRSLSKCLRYLHWEFSLILQFHVV